MKIGKRKEYIPKEFEKAAIRQANGQPDNVRPADMEGRRDLRGLFMVTIDGADAKDLDDAVSLEILDNGYYRLGVHIADVTHYVKENSALDREAYERGTSIYLPDKVIPMLPQKLSNGICSLNAGEDRLALSCVMDIDNTGAVSSHEVFPSVIKVKHRMTYDVVEALLSNKQNKRIKPYQDLLPFFKSLEDLRDILLQKRLKRGAVVLDITDSTVKVDKKGRVLDIGWEERNTATSIIEEAMLVCNETIAEEFFHKRLPFVYRSHETPDKEKLFKLSEVVRYFGYSLSPKASSKDIQRMIDKLDTSSQAQIIGRFVLRSMQQARYTSKNLGHYGLAAKYYCHFTSPIRRYPDLQIHRIIKESLRGPMSSDRVYYLQASMPAVSAQSSFTERRAVEMERAAVSIKKGEFMVDKVKQEFDGVISGITSWGIYVELPNSAEGLVPFRLMDDDMYFLDEKGFSCKGKRHGTIYRLGDSVRVKLVKVWADTGNLDFIIM